jgi:hypothetical protein
MYAEARGVCHFDYRELEPLTPLSHSFMKLKGLWPDHPRGPKNPRGGIHPTQFIRSDFPPNPRTDS